MTAKRFSTQAEEALNVISEDLVKYIDGDIDEDGIGQNATDPEVQQLARQIQAALKRLDELAA